MRWLRSLQLCPWRGCIVALALLVGAATAARAQPDAGPAGNGAGNGDAGPDISEVSLDSPRATMHTFIEQMERIDEGRGDVERAWAIVRYTLDTSAIDAQNDSQSDSQAMRAAARELYEVIRKIGLPADGLPDAETITDRTRYVLFPRPGEHQRIWQRLEQRGAARYPRGAVALATSDDQPWRFTAATVAGAEPLAEALAPLMPAELEKDADLPSAVMQYLGPTFIRTPWWGWGGLLVAIFVGLAAGRVAQGLARRAADRLRRRNRQMRATVFENLASPLSLTLLTVGITAGMFVFVHLEGLIETFAWRVLTFLYLLALAWFLYNLVDLVEVALRRFTQRNSSKLDDTLVPLVRKTLRIFLVIVFSLVIAQNIFGLNITGWLAGLGIAGLAVSLAAQDSVKNLFGSLMIYFDKPFGIGDWIIFDGNEGYIEEIGFRSTRMRLWSRHQVTIPNMKFNDQNVTNVARRPLDRRVFDITITYDTPPDKIEQAVQILDEILHEDEVAEPFDFDNYPPHIGFSDFNDASLNIRVYYYYMQTPGRNYWTYFEHQHMVNMKIIRRFNEAGIDFAFPTQTLHLAGDPKRQLSVQLLESDGRSGEASR